MSGDFFPSLKLTLRLMGLGWMAVYLMTKEGVRVFSVGFYARVFFFLRMDGCFS